MKRLREALEDSSLPGSVQSPIPLTGLDTPALLVDGARLARNLAGMQGLAERAGVRLRPHLKTHKCVPLARLQFAEGATGICTAKVSEGEVFAAAGLGGLCVVYPLVGMKAERLAALAAAHPDERFETAADSERGLEDLGRAAARQGITLGVWIKLDVGLHRAGVDPASLDLERLASRAASTPGLRLAGVVTHAGQVYRSRPGEGRTIGEHEGWSAVKAARRLERAGLGPLGVGVGSTPTAVAAAAVDGVTEIHPGVYVFGDRQQAALGGMRRHDAALTVLAFSSDRGAHGSETLTGFGGVSRPGDHRAPAANLPLPFVGEDDPHHPDPEPAGTPILVRLSEEHGVIESDRDLGLGPGDRVEIVPNHACAAVNLARRLHVTVGEGEARRVTAVWEVEARARVQ
jgi:D-serine deaminase-like pyridoxal phosphate-dependent protein